MNYSMVSESTKQGGFQQKASGYNLNNYNTSNEKAEFSIIPQDSLFE